MGTSDRPKEGDGKRRQPKQPRGQETHDAILAAAGKLFAARGYEETTTHLIAQEAQISVGALYRYFADKQAICLELYQQEISVFRNRLLAQFDIADLVGRDVRDIVRRTVELALRAYSDRAPLRRVLTEQARKIPSLSELRRALEAELHHTVLRILSSFPNVQVPDPEVAAYLISLFVESLLDDYALYHGQPATLDQARLVDGAADFIVRYALGRVAPSA